MNTEKDEIFIKIKGVGFVFLIDKRMKYNLISPALMSFFHPRKKQMYSHSENNIGEVNTKPAYNNLLPFLPEYLNSISTNDVFHFVGKKLVKCKDNKLRVCRIFMLEFEYEECTFSFPFFLDKSLNVPAILGFDSYNKLRKKL